MTFEPRVWERNGVSIELRHLPRRISVALVTGGQVLGWLTDDNAGHLAAVLDVMLADPGGTYGGGSFGGDDTP